MNASNIQQAVSGFKTVEVIGGPCIVRVHEALDAAYSNTPHRYFISVDFKFKAHEALNIGTLGLLGCTKSEATREARALSAKIYTAWSAMKGAAELALNWDIATNRITAKRQAERFENLISKYTAEFVS